MAQPIQGKSNNYPEGQCTRYADQRYHDLTGYFVPWSGNAKDWANLAVGYGWTVTSTPTVPSIMVLQPGVQGADGTYGHVGVVESVPSKSAFFTASNLNWGTNPSVVKSVDFLPGAGVSFIYAGTANGKPTNGTKEGPTLSLNLNDLHIGPTEDITALLNSLDQSMLLTNPFQVSNATTDNIAGVKFTDPVSWVEGFGYNLVGDATALLVRGIFLLVGIVILVKIINNFIDLGAVSNTLATGWKAVL